MVTAGQGGGVPVPDLYQLLGVPPRASGREITRAWRRRAAAEHPDRRPGDAAAPARFLALTEAYHVLGDPARRAAYDRSRGDQPPPGAGVPVIVRRAGRAPEPPLRAGPVRVEQAVRYLAGDRGWPW